MSQEKDPRSPATTSHAWDLMMPRWSKINALLGGTETMRAAETAYLPQHEEESDFAYSERLSKAVLFNATELTLDSMVGRPFADPVKQLDVPDVVAAWLEDVDLQGTDVHTFARDWFRAGMAKAFSHVMVDFPRPRQVTDDAGAPRERTLEDDRVDNLRPYLVEVKPENVIFARAETVDGREVLTHVRIQEVVTEVDGFAEVQIEQIRVWEPGLITVFRKKENARKDDEWEQVDQYEYGLDFIPMVTFYAARDGFMEGKPPLTDLADLNVAHWQSDSDQTSIMTVSRFPMLAATGITTDGGGSDTTVGPNVQLEASDPQAKFYYVEHSGKAIAAGRQDLLDKEERMAEYGSQFLKKRPGTATATARALDSAESTSPLQDMATRFENALNTALQIMGIWANQQETGALEIMKDFGPEEIEAADFDALKDARTRRDISRKTYLEELGRRGVLSDEFDADEDAAELEREDMDTPDTEEDIDPTGGLDGEAREERPTEDEGDDE